MSDSPKINIENIRDIDIAIFIGKQDDLSNPIDARRLKDELGSVVKLYLEIEMYDHSSFLLGKKMDYLDDILTLLQNTNI